MGKKKKASTSTVSVTALERVAKLAENTGKWGVASKALEALCQHFPNMPRLRHRQALVFLQMKNVPKAVRSFLMSVDFYLDSGNRSMAIAILNQAVRQIPESPELASRLEALYKGRDWKPMSAEQRAFQYASFGEANEFFESPEDIQAAIQELDTVEFTSLVVSEEPAEERIEKEEKKFAEESKEKEEGPLQKAVQFSKILRLMPKEILVDIEKIGKIEEFETEQQIQSKSQLAYLVVEGSVKSSLTQQFSNSTISSFKKGDLILPTTLPEASREKFFLTAMPGTKIMSFTKELLEISKAKNSSFANYLEDRELHYLAVLMIRRSSVFGELSPEKLQKIKPLFIHKAFEKDQKVTEEGLLREPIFYLILDGELSVYRRYDSENPSKLSDLFPGDFFGERSFLASTPSMATIIANSKTKVLALSRSQIDHVIQIFPAFTERLTKVSENRVRIALSKELQDHSSDSIQIVDQQAEQDAVKRQQRSIYESEVFLGVEKSKVDEILKSVPLEKHEKGSVLLKKGAKSNCVIIIKNGLVKEYDFSEDGEEKVIGWHAAGSCFGEEGLSEFPTYSSFFEVSETSEVYILSYQ